MHAMSLLRFPLRCAIGISLALLSSGCLTRVPVTFHVTDTDTGNPIASANVWAWTPTGDFNHDLAMTLTGQTAHDQGRTDSDGRVTLKVPSGRLGCHVSAQGQGYMTGHTHFSPYWASSVTTRPVIREVQAYPLPIGKAVLILPDGLRGILRVISRGRADYVAGKRVFEFPADINGITSIPSVNPILQGGSSLAFDLQARFAGSGELLPRQNHVMFLLRRARTTPDAIAFRLVAMNDIRSIFVVGTEEDATEFQNANGLIVSQSRWSEAFDRIFPRPD